MNKKKLLKKPDTKCYIIEFSGRRTLQRYIRPVTKSFPLKSISTKNFSRRYYIVKKYKNI